MKSIYEIQDKGGKHLCYQVAKSEKGAVEFARTYGHRSAAKAVFVREDQ